MNDRVVIHIENHVARVALNRPDKHNAMDFAMVDAVIAAQQRLAGMDDVRGVILCGEGPSFCSGLDVKAVFGDKRKAAQGYARLWSPVRNAFQTWSMGWRALPLPVIAVIHGNCFGAGIQLALGADIRIATPDAKIAIMESRWGLVADMGGPTLLRELLPLDVAKELAMTGRVLSGSEAQALGLVTHVDPAPGERAAALLGEIAERSPDAVAAAKFVMQEAWGSSEYSALAAERRRQRQLVTSPNQKIAVKRNAGGELPAFVPRKIRR